MPLLVAAVDPADLAARAGLHAGDVVLSVDGVRVGEGGHARAIARMEIALAAGRAVSIAYERAVDAGCETTYFRHV